MLLSSQTLFVSLSYECVFYYDISLTLDFDKILKYDNKKFSQFSGLIEFQRITPDYHILKEALMKESLKDISIRNILKITFAGIVNAFGITIFLYPVHLYDSGISGTSMLLAQVTPEHFSLSLFLIILNIPLFLYGLKKEGIVFTIYSIYSVLKVLTGQRVR